MKRLSFVLAMLVAVLVFGLGFLGCDNGTTEEPEPEPGTFTLTDIPEQYNGKYAFLSTSSSVSRITSIYGYESGGPYDVSVGFLTPFQAPIILCRVNNGKVVIPLWIHGENNRYTGNETFVTNIKPSGEVLSSILVTIYEQATISAGYETNNGQLGLVLFESITFSNGIATASYNDRYVLW